MKSLAYAQERVLIGDDAADGLMAYAVRLASLRLTEAIELHVLSASGDPVTAGLLLTPGASLMTATVTSAYAEPDNAELIDYMHQEMTGSVVGTAPDERAGDAVMDDMDVQSWFALGERHQS